jgi:catechol 2,3-dioxygenase-like lactoylglutathione lyase family enzyme
MISHLSLGTRDLDRAQAFYDAALGALGYARVWRADTAVGYGVPGGDDKLAIKDRSAEPGPLAAGPGFHLAFAAPSREAVDAFHAAALAAGGTDDGAPGLRPHYGERYYAAFVSDPDGHKLEAVHQ